MTAAATLRSLCGYAFRQAFNTMSVAVRTTRSLSSTQNPANDISSQMTTIQGQPIHYETAGSGPEIIFMLPGALGSSRTDFLPQLSRLDGNKFTLACWDPPGYGNSRPPNREWPEDFFHRDAKTAIELIKQEFDGRATLLGWSDGGITALVMATLSPDVVDKLIVFGSNAYITQTDVQMVEKIRDLSLWSEKMREPYERIYGPEHFEQLWNEWIDAYASYLPNRNGDICRFKIKEIEKPTLIIHGQKDALVVQEHSDFLHSQIKGSELVNWPEAKHNLHLRYIDEFNALITGFIDRVNSGSQAKSHI